MNELQSISNIHLCLMSQTVRRQLWMCSTEIRLVIIRPDQIDAGDQMQIWDQTLGCDSISALQSHHHQLHKPVLDMAALFGT